MENSPGSSDPSPVSELVARADSILRDHTAKSSLANLHTAIYLLAQPWINHSPQNSECLNLLATALLTRFSYTGQWKDVQIAGIIHGGIVTGLTSHILGVLTELVSDVLQMDDNPDDIVALAANILTDFHQPTNLLSLDTAICLYDEAISGQDSAGIDKYKTMRQLVNAYLIQFCTTGDPKGVQKSISLVRQLYGSQPNQVSWLCAALLSNVEFTNVMEAAGLIQQTSKVDRNGLKFADTGTEFLKVFDQAGDNLNLDMGIAALEKAAAQLTWGHDQRESVLSNLGTALFTRFEMRGSPQDLNNAIRLHHEALDLYPVPHPKRGGSLNNLAIAFYEWFQTRGDAGDLDNAIVLHREALDLHPVPHPDRGSSLNNLAIALHERFQTRGDAEDLDNAILLHREALDSCPAPNPDRGSLLNNLAIAFRERFQTRGDAGDLDNVIVLHREALDLHPVPHPDHDTSLNNLAIAFHERFQTRGDVRDLENAIVLHREALDLRPAPHPERGGSLDNLASVLHERFQTRGDVGDLENAIVLHREALDLHPAPHPDRGSSLNNLAIAFHGRFQTRGDAGDLENAIVLHREALDLRPAPHPERGSSLNNLASAFHERFQTQGVAGDLENAIMLHREALGLCPDPHPDRGSSFNNLASVLYKRFQTRGDAEDLDDAIGLHHEALNLHPAPHPKRGGSLNNLAIAFHERFQTRGDAGDLNNAIVLHREALDLHPVPHPDRGSSLNNLAIAFHERFQTRGDAEDLENAIVLHREALDLHLAPHPECGGSLNNLASVLYERFQTRGDMRDLENAIVLHRQALDLRQAPHPDRATSLNNVANVLEEWFSIRGDAGDLENAIVLHREALDLRPAPHPDHGSSLNNLASVLYKQFQTRGDVGDLDNVIRLYREALHLHPVSHSVNGSFLNNLANALHQRFLTRGDAEDLENAINLCTEAQGVLQPPHPHRGMVLRHLATQLMLKHEHSSDSTIMEDAIIAFRESSRYLPSPVSERCNAATNWARHADKNKHDSALEAYETSVELLPQQAMLGLDIQSRQKALTLESAVGLATDAAACASRLNEIGKAVELLEAGRSVFWSQALQLHTSLDELKAVHPELAERIQNISNKLEVGSHRAVASIRMLPAVHKDHMMLDKDDAHYRKLNAEWVEVIDEVRCQPRFQRFLRPKLMNELKAAAINGPIIILNVSRSSCTAFIVTLSRDVQSVNLEHLTWDRAQLLVDLLRALLSQNSVHTIQTLTKIQGREVSTGFPMAQERLKGNVETSEQHTPNNIFTWLLGELWTLIVQPVFHALALKKSDHPSRLWWCPTGPFTFLPIHAAGLYKPYETDCVSDYVLSSYTHNLTTLLNPPIQTASPFKMMAVIQPTTDNCSDLPATVDELARIKQQVPSQWLTSLGDTTPAKVDVALQHLQESSVVHFACHGTQDLQNPLETGLLLTDGRLKVSELMQGKSQKKSIKLAFLSACETVKGDDTMPDEAMHLAATLLFAGFQGVIATMWTMADPDGPKIAETFYQHLFKGCGISADPPDLTKAAECLHIAVAKLRADPNVPFNRWVPFVHYGL
ncbi:CHAT domain-containing protein [Mycena epipterygia]|nr:CHAT domain-containing protein [Mycena epipterygia]